MINNTKIKFITLIIITLITTILSKTQNTEATGGTMFKNISENVAVIEVTDHKKIEKVVITVVDNTNIYNVFTKNGKVDVLTADNKQAEAPKEVQKLIAELKEAGVQPPRTRFFANFIIWFW